MKSKLLVWLIFAVSAQSILILAAECFSGPPISTQNTQGQEVRGLNETGEFSEKADGKSVISVARKSSKGKGAYGGAKGKGAYGGANIIHRPPRHRNAASSSAPPSFLVFSGMLATFRLIRPRHF